MQQLGAEGASLSISILDILTRQNQVFKYGHLNSDIWIANAIIQKNFKHSVRQLLYCIQSECKRKNTIIIAAF